MTDATLNFDAPEFRSAPAAFRTAVAISRRGWRRGSLTFVFPSGREMRVDGDESGPDGRLIVHDFRFVGRVLAAADIGFGEGYIAGEWDTPDLAALLEAFTANFDTLEKLVNGNPLVRAFNALAHALNRNTRSGSRRNIQVHYDLGNAFYAGWLDRSMTYSSGLYPPNGGSLVEAQALKYAAMADAVGLKPGQTVLEIGCGWGGFAEYAARERGAIVTGLTLSREQADYARQRLFAAGLAERANIELTDYRDARGAFDAVVSIEMFEAVGEAYWGDYFAKVREVLSPGGRAGLQIITVRDDLFETYRQRSDFIRKYVFPGGMLPSESRLRRETDKAGLSWGPLRRFGQDYARTLHEWAVRFDASWSDIRGLGFDERFRRLWLFYLRYCEAGFRTERTNVVQLALTRA